MKPFNNVQVTNIFTNSVLIWETAHCCPIVSNNPYLWQVVTLCLLYLEGSGGRYGQNATIQLPATTIRVQPKVSMVTTQAGGGGTPVRAIAPNTPKPEVKGTCINNNNCTLVFFKLSLDLVRESVCLIYLMACV